MTLINLLKPGLGELFGLSVLSLMGVAMAFMVMTMASGLESRAMSDLGSEQASSETANGTAGEIAMLGR